MKKAISQDVTQGAQHPLGPVDRGPRANESSDEADTPDDS